MMRLPTPCFAPAHIVALSLLGLVATPAANAQTEGHDLYNVTMLRAAPGEFVALLEALQHAAAVDTAGGDAAPFALRHSQGDEWDIMLIYPMMDFPEYYSGSRVAQRERAWGTERAIALRTRIASLTASKEEWFARSIPREEMARRFKGVGLYHIEMFAGLPGKRAALLEQRRMENRYYAQLNRQLNVLFTRASGSNWDAMTIGFHPSLQAFAEAGTRFSESEQDAAAQLAGFEGIDAIGPYLRSLLSYHRDTFATPVK